MPLQQVRVRVPGKLMLAGEYAILAGAEALAVTVDRYLEVTSRRRSDTAVVISGEMPGKSYNYDSRLRSTNEPFLKPLLDSLALAKTNHALQGIELNIASKLDPSYGLGSSSALRLAILVACRALVEKAPNWLAEAQQALDLQRRHQGRASGYDIATQIYGGLVTYTPTNSPLSSANIKKQTIPKRLASHLRVYIGGRGAPTKSVMTQTLDWLERERLWEELKRRSQNLLRHLQVWLAEPESTFLTEDTELEPPVVAKGGALAQPTCQAANAHKHKSSFGEVIRAIAKQRQLFEASPCFPHSLLKVLKALPGFDQAWSFKTTGAGGEDAILVFAPPEKHSMIQRCLAESAWTPMPARLSEQGIECVTDSTSSP